MTKLFKFKLFIICLVILAVITSAAAFSVSYAKWTGEENNQVSAGVTTGDWSGSENNDLGFPPFDNGIRYGFGDDKKDVELSLSLVDGTYWIYIKTMQENQRLQLKIGGEGFEISDSTLLLLSDGITHENNMLIFPESNVVYSIRFSPSNRNVISISKLASYMNQDSLAYIILGEEPSVNVPKK